MTGRWLLIGGGVVLAVFTVVLWYTQYYAYYQELPAPENGLMGTYPIETWQAIDGTSSPLKLRVCATVTPETVGQITDDLDALLAGDPLVAPSWFECFDARSIAQDLDAGAAALYQLGPSRFDGVNEVMALYPDGRIFMWRVLDERFQGS